MIEVACGIMKNKDGKILMGLRPHSKIKTGIWEFPGGKLEDDESIVECLKREWIEELNLNIAVDDEITSFEYHKYFCRFFTGTILDEHNLQKNVHLEVNFFDKKEIYKLKLFDSDYKILKLI